MSVFCNRVGASVLVYMMSILAYGIPLKSAYSQDLKHDINKPAQDIIGLELGVPSDKAIEIIKASNAKLDVEYTVLPRSDEYSYALDRPQEIMFGVGLEESEDDKRANQTQLLLPKMKLGIIAKGPLGEVHQERMYLEISASSTEKQVVGITRILLFYDGIDKPDPNKYGSTSGRDLTSILTLDSLGHTSYTVDEPDLKDAPTVASVKQTVLDKYGTKFTDYRENPTEIYYLWAYDKKGRLLSSPNSCTTGGAGFTPTSLADIIMDSGDTRRPDRGGVAQTFSSGCDYLEIRAIIQPDEEEPLLARAFSITAFNQNTLYNNYLARNKERSAYISDLRKKSDQKVIDGASKNVPKL